MNSGEIAESLDQIAAGRCDLHSVASEFRRSVDDPEDPDVRAAMWALGYRLIHSSDETGRGTYGPFAPMAELGDLVFPPYVGALPPDVVESWAQLVNEIRYPAIAGRLHDLLWVTCHGDRPDEYARQANADYRAATRQAECDNLEAAAILDRALELARALNAPDLALPVVQCAREVLDSELRRKDASSRPGVSIPLFRLLASLPEADRPDDLLAKLADAHVLLESTHPFIRESLFQLDEMLARGRTEDVAQLRRAKVQMWFDYAQEQDGPLRIVELSKTLELADNAPEAADLRDEIRRQIQDIDPDSQGFRTVSAKFDVPIEQVEGLILSVVGDDGIEPAVERFGVWGPPTGDPAATADVVDEQIRQFPMRFIVPQVVSHPAGYPIRFLDTDDEKREAALVRHSALAASIQARFAMEALDRIGAKYGPSRDDLQALFETSLIRANQADAFARAFQHYWADRPDEAIHVALPRIEAVLRRLLAEAGGVVYKEPQGPSAGGVRGLGTVLHNLRLVLDKSGW